MKPMITTSNTTENNFFLGLSSNLGNRIKNIKTAISHLKKISKIKQISSYYETEPVGYLDQDWFINIVIEGKTTLGPQDLLEQCLKIENNMGRVRKIKNGPRNIDIDLLYYEERIITTKHLTLPHPEIQNRNFVLTPLSEISPKMIHPILKKDSQQLLKELRNPDTVKKLA